MYPHDMLLIYYEQEILPILNQFWFILMLNFPPFCSHPEFRTRFPSYEAVLIKYEPRFCYCFHFSRLRCFQKHIAWCCSAVVYEGLWSGRHCFLLENGRDQTKHPAAGVRYVSRSRSHLIKYKRLLEDEYVWSIRFRSVGQLLYLTLGEWKAD